MSFPDAFTPDAVSDFLPTVPRDFGERFTLNWKAARSPDRSFFYDVRMHDLWEDALDKLRLATGKTFPNPAAFARPQEQLANVLRFGTRRNLDLEQQALAAMDEWRNFDPTLPDPRRFDDKVRTEATELRKNAERSALASYGAGGLGAFLGASAGELSHPAQLATLPIGASYAAANIARIGLLRFVGRAALTEGAVAGVTQAGVEMLDAPLQAQLATDGPGSGNEFGDRVNRVLFAAAGGALIGAGLAGLVAAARGVSRRIKPTLDEADALKVAERAVYGEQRNPLGRDSLNAHTAALNKAEVEVAAGRHADVREIVAEEVRRQIPPVVASKEKVIPSLTSKAPDDVSAEGLVVVKDDRDYTLFRDGERIGFAQIMPSGDVGMVNIVPEARRQGYATKLYEAIEQDLGKPLGQASIKTREGSAFREAYEARRELAGGIEPPRAQQGAAPPVRADGEPIDMKAALASMRRIASENEPAHLPAPQKTFDILDSAAATRPIADAAPVVPEKAAATAKAEIEIANAKAIAETNPGAKAALEAASEETKMANKVKNCAMGVGIG